MAEHGITISLLQAVELAALAPCLFVIAYLSLRRGMGTHRIVPLLYFLAVAAGLLVPLVAIWPDLPRGSEGDFWLRGGLTLLQSSLPALTFLLLLQVMTRRVPKAAYWLILALPLFGGAPLVYASLLLEEICLDVRSCFRTEDFGTLYAIFATSVIFLLLLARFARRNTAHSDNAQEQHQYWLMIALIGLNLLLMGIWLAQLAGFVRLEAAGMASSLLHLSFIYIVMTVLFRVFGPGENGVASRQPRRAPEQEEERVRDVLARFAAMLEQEHIYREMTCSRERVARSLGVNENYLSRIVNQHYGKRFTDIVNGYRIREAQEMLKDKPEESITSIAFAVGFSSIPSFNRVFKETTGESPRSYRTKNSG